MTLTDDKDVNCCLGGLHVEFEDLHSLDLLKKDSGFNIYKASFAHQTLAKLLALTEENPIEGFRLVPFKTQQFPDQKKEDKQQP